MKWVLLALSLFFAGLLFAGTCPPGDSNCFLCGGVGGIPCSTNCTGHYSPGIGEVACECPQGHACICYCPVTVNGTGSTPTAGAGTGSGPAPTGITITALKGDDVYVMVAGGQWAKASGAVPLSKKDSIRVGKGSIARLDFDDGSKMWLDEETTVEMKEFERHATTFDVIIELVKGALFSDVVNRQNLEIETSVSVFGVKGTKFSAYYDDVKQEATVKTVEGVVEVTDNYGSTTELKAGEMVRVTNAGLGNIETFSPYEEERKWDLPTGFCGSAFILLAVLGAVLAVRRES